MTRPDPRTFETDIDLAVELIHDVKKSNAELLAALQYAMTAIRYYDEHEGAENMLEAAKLAIKNARNLS